MCGMQGFIPEKSFGEAYAVFRAVADERDFKFSLRMGRASCGACSGGVHSMAVDGMMKLTTYRDTHKVDAPPLLPPFLFLDAKGLDDHVQLVEAQGGNKCDVRHSMHVRGMWNAL